MMKNVIQIQIQQSKRITRLDPTVKVLICLGLMGVAYTSATYTVPKPITSPRHVLIMLQELGVASPKVCSLVCHITR